MKDKENKTHTPAFWNWVIFEKKEGEGRLQLQSRRPSLQLHSKFKGNAKRMAGYTNEEEDIKQENCEIKTLGDHLGRSMLTPWEEEGSIKNHSTH